MKTFKVLCTWTMQGTVEVQANSAEEANQKSMDQFCKNPGLPADGQYLEDSFESDPDNIEEIK